MLLGIFYYGAFGKNDQSQVRSNFEWKCYLK